MNRPDQVPAHPAGQATKRLRLLSLSCALKSVLCIPCHRILCVSHSVMEFPLQDKVASIKVQPAVRERTDA